jgi:hypothetical protein
MRQKDEAHLSPASYVRAMAGPSEFTRRLESTAPLAGDIGGLLFFAYWMNRSRGLGIPPLLGLLLDLATMVLVGAAVLGYQITQADAGSAWVGWVGVTAIAMGFVGWLAMVPAGLAIFGLSIVRCKIHPRLPGYLLMAGGTVLLVALALAPAFGRAWANPSPVWGAVMGCALIAIAGALADLDALRREQPTTHLTSASRG